MSPGRALYRALRWAGVTDIDPLLDIRLPHASSSSDGGRERYTKDEREAFCCPPMRCRLGGPLSVKWTRQGRWTGNYAPDTVCTVSAGSAAVDEWTAGGYRRHSGPGGRVYLIGPPGLGPCHGFGDRPGTGDCVGAHNHSAAHSRHCLPECDGYHDSLHCRKSRVGYCI
jgi:hypothetical protein